MDRKNWRWHHKWVGLVLSIIVVLYSISGIILNHRRTFASMSVSRGWLPEKYQYDRWNGGLLKGSFAPTGSDLPQILLYGSSGVWATDSLCRSVRDFSTGIPSGPDHRQIKGLVQMPDGSLFAAGQFTLYRYEGEWRPVDMGQASLGRLADLTRQGDSLVVLSRDFVYLSLPPYQEWQRIELQTPRHARDKASVFKHILKLHSGDLFGLVGRLVVDAVAIALIVLCFTGIIRWFCPQVMHRLRRRARTTRRWAVFNRDNVHLHNKIGVWTFGLLLLITFTGMCLRQPLAIPTIKRWTLSLPGTTLHHSNPWHDNLRMIRYDSTAGLWLLNAGKHFYALPRLTDTPRKMHGMPSINAMGAKVFEQLPNGRWLVASSEGAFECDITTQTSYDYTSGEVVSRHKEGKRSHSNKSVVGFTPHFVDSSGDPRGSLIWSKQGSDFAPMPDALADLPMSLWSVALEIHTGRIFTFLSSAGKYYTFLSGVLILWVIVSGWFIRFRRKTKKTTTAGGSEKAE